MSPFKSPALTLNNWQVIGPLAPGNAAKALKNSPFHVFAMASSVLPRHIFLCPEGWPASTGNGRRARKIIRSKPKTPLESTR